MTKRLLSPRATAVVPAEMISTPGGRFARDAALPVVLAASLGGAVGALAVPDHIGRPAAGRVGKQPNRNRVDDHSYVRARAHF